MSVVRLACQDSGRLVELADRILTAWRGYTDEAATISAEDEGVPYNTITLIARMRDGKYELDLALVGTIDYRGTSPGAVFHPTPSFTTSRRRISA